jgi:hypothetical protein
VVDCVHDWQDVFLRVLGRRMVFAADEYYLIAGRPFPDAEAYEGFAMHEDGIGMARTFELEFTAGPHRHRAAAPASSPPSTRRPAQPATPRTPVAARPPRRARDEPIAAAPA